LRHLGSFGVGTVGTRVRVGTTITGVFVVFDGRGRGLGTRVVGIQMEGLGTVGSGEPVGRRLVVGIQMLGFGTVGSGEPVGRRMVVGIQMEGLGTVRMGERVGMVVGTAVGIQMEGLGTVRMGEPLGAVGRAMLVFGTVRMGVPIEAVGRTMLGREEAGGSWTTEVAMTGGRADTLVGRMIIGVS
jgi:hypothetical protein